MTIRIIVLHEHDHAPGCVTLTGDEDLVIVCTGDDHPHVCIMRHPERSDHGLDVDLPADAGSSPQDALQARQELGGPRPIDDATAGLDEACGTAAGAATPDPAVHSMPMALQVPVELTVQQRRVLALVGEGMTNRQIGGCLGLSERTVRNYVSQLLAALNVHNRTEAALLVSRLAARHRRG